MVPSKPIRNAPDFTVLDETGDYIVVEPGIPGDGTGVDIRSVEVDILEAADAAS